MKRIWWLLVLLVVVAACTRSAETTTTIAPGPAADDDDPGFYLMLMWHQHQPFYPKDSAGVYTRPWVRVHATKDYYDMAAMVEDYPQVSVTFNLTPVLLLQLEDLAAGAKDVYWTTSEIDADLLDDEQKQFIRDRFFDVNPGIVARFPRYQELAGRRDDEGWQPADYRDLQVLFNLAWTDPDFLSEQPLRSLVEKGRDFSEDDKSVIFAEHLRIIAGVIPLHSRLWEAGRIEVTTTPLAHPILPLIADTTLASVGDPAALLPDNRWQEIPDADQQVIRGLDLAERVLGRRPVGMWPAEGSVAQLVMSLFSKNGVRWVATGEDVLAQSLDLGSFSRDSRDTVEEAETLYRPWAAQLRRNDPVAMFFRDVRISDQLGFEYSGMSAEAAAADFMGRLQNIYQSLDVTEARDRGQPYVVSVILDGENAWENYENDGKDFLNALYQSLSEADWVKTITPSQYLERFGDPEPLEEVFPASWFQPNFATWIGEPEEATAWDYLYRVRQDLKAAEGADGYDRAFDKMLFAEGSDWFWWYGSDQDSGDDGYFDRAFRELLGQVYDALGIDRPPFIEVPIIPQQAVLADNLGEGSGSYNDIFPGGFNFTIDRNELALFVGTNDPFEIYLGTPDGERTARASDGQVLGFGATKIITWDGATAVLCDFQSSCLPIEATGGNGTTMAVPLAELGALESGDGILAKVLEGRTGRLVPEEGPMAFQVPDISNVVLFLDVADPLGDDHGPGTYRYPTDAVFTAGSYDLELFQVGTEDDNVVFTFDMVAPIQNPWGSPRGLSVQTFDIYIDTDPGNGTGAQLLIPGRNAVLPEGNGWEYAITVEGWDPAIYVAAPDGVWEETKPSFDVVVFGDQGKVVIRIPRSLFAAGDLTSWGYAAAVMSQEGFPSGGVRRIRDVESSAQQWRIGGGTGAINETRIMDVASFLPGEQEQLLSSYSPVTSGPVDDLAPDDFGAIPLLQVIAS